MAKQLNVNLSFTADTGKARAQLQDLQNQLTKLINTPASNFNLEQDISGAVRAAAELKSHLTAATNVKTGNLDFTKLNQSITKSGKSLTAYAEQLRALGPSGQQAFISLANAVATSEVPIRRTNTLLKEMGVTLANTARWQISSSILHGFMRSVQSAYGYAQDLNESLNNIRIVTGQNIDQMSEFAEKANRAAKALSTTTTNYTNASLIYYQQGLSDKEVQERTDITIKMANVSRTSAEEVSDQLTAVWNNFYDGSKSLEYYADVMTALGAATASSTDEISDGLNKFAAVAETVGLSYEYAAAALATVTATTRQSADVVGNAFKTLFARLQGLNLGETLDDGTTLNKYSQALMDVGIDIKDVNGDIKDMDTILNELGRKWETLGKDQQIALAQTVAGVRQYTQLIALMDNWDYFQENLGVVNTSSGALQEQADIYAQSWEAASKRVKAAAQGIYQDLIDDKFFIGLLNQIEKILGFVDNLIDGLGGLKGVLTVVSTLMMKTFSQQMAQGITNMAYNLQMTTQKGRNKVQQQRVDTLNTMVGMLPENEDYVGKSEATRIATMRETIDLQSSLTEKASKMSQLELTTNQYLLDRVKILSEQNINAAQNLEKAEEKQATTVGKAQAQIASNAMLNNTDNQAAVDQTRKGISALADRQTDLKNISQLETAFLNIKKQGSLTDKEIKNLQDTFNKIGSTGPKALKNIFQGLQENDAESEDWKKTIEDLDMAIDLLYGEQKKRMVFPNGSIGIDTSTADEMIDNARNVAQANVHAREANDNFNKGVQDSKKGIEDANGAQAHWADGLVSYASAIGAVTSAIRSLTGLIDVWNNKDMSFGEKLLTTFSTLAMILPMVTMSFTKVKLQQMASATASLAQALGLKAVAVATKKASEANASYGASLAVVLGTVIAVTVAIVAIIAVVKLFTSAKKDEAKELKAANKALEQSKNAYEEATAAVQKFKNEISDYSEALKALTNLEAGTKEMADAIEKANEKAKQLIDTYHLFGQYHYGDNGEIIFNDGVLDNIQHQLETRDKVAKTSYYTATIRQIQAQYDYDLAQTAKNLGTYTVRRAYTLTPVGGGYSAKTYKDGYLTEDEVKRAQEQNDLHNQSRGYIDGAGFEVETSTRQISAEDIKSIGLVVEKLDEIPTSADGLIAAIQAMEDETESSSGLADYILKDIESFINKDTFSTLVDFNSGVQEVSDACKHYANEITGLMTDDDYAESIARASGGNEGLASVMNAAKNTLLNSEDINLGQLTFDKQDKLITDVLTKTDGKDAGTNAKTNIQSFVNDIFSGTEGYDYDAWLAENYGKIFAGSTQGYSSDLTTQDMGRAWFESQGYTVTNVENKKGKTVYSLMKDGEVVGDQTLSNEQAQDNWQTMIGNYAIDEYISSQAASKLDPKQFEEMMTNIVANGEQYGTNFANAIIAGIANGSKEFNFSNLYGEISQKEFDEIQGMSGKDLAEKFLGITDEEELKKLGFDSWESFENGFKAGMEDWDSSIYQNAVNEKYEKIAKDSNLDVETFKAYRKSAEAGKGFENDTDEDYANTWLTGLKENNIGEYAEALNKLAIVNTRFSRGQEKLTSNWEEWNSIMLDSEASIHDINKIMPDLNESLADILNWDVKDIELLPHDFAQKYWDVIQDVYNGVDGAVEKLAGLAAHEYIISLNINTEGLRDTAEEAYNSIMSQLENMPDLEVGMTLDSTNMTKALNTLLEQGTITADQMNDILSKIGFTPEIKYKTITVNSDHVQSIRANGGYDKVNPDGTTEWVPIDNSTDVNTYIGTKMQIPYIDGQESRYTGSGGSIQTLQQPKGKGGGGGQKKQKKSSSDEKDRYHVVREKLDDLNKAQERIAKSKEQAFGKSKVDLMQAEIEVLDDLIAKQDEYLDEIDDYLRKDRAKMIIYGAEFDENGVISNYDALLQKELDIYNAAVEKFNKDGNEEAFEAAEKRYENFKKDLEQYEETMDLWEDEQAERAEMMREKWDQQFEALTYEIEFKLDIEEDSLKLLDYFLSKIEDDAFAAAEAIGLLGQQTQDAMDKIELNRQGIEGLLGMHNLDMSILDQIQKGEVSLEDLGEYGFSDEEISQLRTYVEGLMDGNTELLELRETIQDKVLGTLDAWNEKIDTNIDKMDNLTSIMESYQSIIELVGKSTLKLNDDFLNNLAQEGVNNSVNKLATSVAKYNGLLEEQARAQEALDKARESGSEQDIKLWEKTLQEVGTMVDEAQQGMMDSWNEALESAANAFEQAVANAVDTFEKSMAGAFGNLDGLQEVFDQQAEIAERYLADYAKIYELNKLNRDITNSIDDNDSIKAKRVLRDLQKEINDLQESETELSQYDVDHLRKKYELRLAEIALEEAQNAKSQVRMRRDTEGNWSYVYTADENKIEEARQNYEDKLYEMQELNNEYIHEMQSNILKSEVELANALRELDKVKFASDEEYYAEVARLQGYYLGQHNYYTDELNKALGNNQETYNVDWTNYSNLTGYKISKNEEYADKFNETILSQLTGYQTLEEVQDAFTNHSQAMVEDLKVAYDNWKANYDTIFNTAGTSIDNFANTTASAYERIATESQKATEDAQQTAKDMTTAFDDICTAVTTWQETWSTALSEAIKENEKFIASTYNLIKALSELKGTIPETDKPSESTQEDINNAKNELNNSNNNITNVSGGNGDKDKKSTYRGYNNEGQDEDLIKQAQVKLEVTADGKWGKKSQDAAYKKYKLTSVTEVLKIMDLLDKDEEPETVPAPVSGSGSIRKELNKGFILFDTGGYTGTWNNTNGRLAMLHQKELVLNEMDTANMLKAIEIVRSIARVIDLNAGSQANGLGYLNATSANNHNQVIEQEVTIHAEFPNATDHNEIEMAFDTLINRASQFANRKNI